MFAYSPDKFDSLYATDLGQHLWAFLIRPEQDARLQTVSEQGKPAVEGIEVQLMEAFRKEVLADRVKRWRGTWCAGSWSGAVGYSIRPMGRSSPHPSPRPFATGAGLGHLPCLSQHQLSERRRHHDRRQNAPLPPDTAGPITRPSPARSKPLWPSGPGCPLTPPGRACARFPVRAGRGHVAARLN